MKLICICYLPILLLLGCNNPSPVMELKSVIETNLRRNIILPENLRAHPIADSILLKQSEIRFKLITYIDGDCSVCIAELYKWKEFLKINFDILENVQVMFVINSVNYPYFEYNVEKMDLGLPYYYDTINSYIINNKIEDFELYTLLLNQENEVLLIGSPIDNPSMQELYKKVIKPNGN